MHLAETARLDDLRVVADELRVEALLAADRPADAAAAAALVLGEQPLREHARRLGMLGLYRSGRHAEALRLADEGRRAMRDLGLSPSPELAELEQAILDHDPRLLAVGCRHVRSSRRRWPAPVATPAARRPGPRPGTPFVGRAAEMADLAAVVDAVAAGAHAGRGGRGRGGHRQDPPGHRDRLRMRGSATAPSWRGATVRTSPWAAPFWPIVELLRDLDAAAALQPPPDRAPNRT